MFGLVQGLKETMKTKTIITLQLLGEEVDLFPNVCLYILPLGTFTNKILPFITHRKGCYPPMGKFKNELLPN